MPVPLMESRCGAGLKVGRTSPASDLKGSTGEGVEKREPSHTVGGKAN